MGAGLVEVSFWRDADWLNGQRVRAYAAMIGIASLALVAVAWIQAQEPEGSDFLAFWGSARAVLAGLPQAAYDLAWQAKAQTGAGFTGWYAFVNPPPFLIVTAPFGLLPAAFGFLAADQYHRVTPYDPMRQRRFVHLALDKAEFGRAAQDLRCCTLSVVDRQLDRDLRVAFVEGGELCGQPVARDRLACDDPQRSTRKPGIVRQHRLGMRCPPQHRARFLQKAAACFGQLDATPDAVKQRNPVARFEGSNRAGGSRLRDVQHLRCLCNVFALGDTDEDSELLQGHAAYIAQSDRYDQPFDLLIPIWISERSAAVRL